MNLDLLAKFQNVEVTIARSYSKIGKLPFFLFQKLFRLYIYGGHDIREGTLDNLWMLDLSLMDDLDMQPEDQERNCKWQLLKTSCVKGV